MYHRTQSSGAGGVDFLKDDLLDLRSLRNGNSSSRHIVLARRRLYHASNAEEGRTVRRKFAIVFATALVATFGVACGGVQEDIQKQAEEQVQKGQQEVEKQAQEVTGQVEQKAREANEQIEQEAQQVQERVKQEVGKEQ
jgi:hypothetical protein